MSRLQDLARYWSWLPAFRAVAESEHPPRAGEILGTSPSSLSRSVKLLEQEMGEPLFTRRGGRLVLNERGRELLRSLRDAMGRIGECVAHPAEASLRGEVALLAAGAVTTAWLVPVLETVRGRHPDLLPIVLTEVGGTLDALLAGEVHLAFQSRSFEHPELVNGFLREKSVGIYCRRGHPLSRRSEIGIEELLEHEFVGAAPDAAGGIADGWPARHRRRFGLHVDQTRVGLEACAGSDLLAVLPDVIGPGVVARSALVRLPLDGFVAPTPIIAPHRRDLSPDGVGAAILAAMRAAVAEETGSPPAR